MEMVFPEMYKEAGWAGEGGDPQSVKVKAVMLAAAAACANARQAHFRLGRAQRTLPVVEMPNEYNDSHFYKLDLHFNTYNLHLCTRII